MNPEIRENKVLRRQLNTSVLGNSFGAIFLREKIIFRNRTNIQEVDKII